MRENVIHLKWDGYLLRRINGGVIGEICGKSKRGWEWETNARAGCSPTFQQARHDVLTAYELHDAKSAHGDDVRIEVVG